MLICDSITIASIVGLRILIQFHATTNFTRRLVPGGIRAAVIRQANQDSC